MLNVLNAHVSCSGLGRLQDNLLKVVLKPLDTCTTSRIFFKITFSIDFVSPKTIDNEVELIIKSLKSLVAARIDEVFSKIDIGKDASTIFLSNTKDLIGQKTIRSGLSISTEECRVCNLFEFIDFDISLNVKNLKLYNFFFSSLFVACFVKSQNLRICIKVIEQLLKWISEVSILKEISIFLNLFHGYSPYK